MTTVVEMVNQIVLIHALNAPCIADPFAEGFRALICIQITNPVGTGAASKVVGLAATDQQDSERRSWPGRETRPGGSVCEEYSLVYGGSSAKHLMSGYCK